ncbi:MAG: phosphoglycolate phosphatase [Betaproteobacteria bacterium]|nr:phosphoglycolate phosphatase [Betaproteobacteria bacterium]
MRFPLRVGSVTLDLDGTLLDTVPDLAEAANAMLRELGRPQRSEDEIRRFVGRGIPNLVKRCLSGDAEPSAALLEQANAAFRRHYAVSNGRRTRAYPGVMEGLERMRAMGLKLGCVTNKAAAFTEPLLAVCGLADYLQVVVSGDSLPEKKPHPLPLLFACERMGVHPSQNLHIGDSRHDVSAARAAGCPVFCVPYGYNEGEDVREVDCDAIVSNLMDAALRIVTA